MFQITEPVFSTTPLALLSRAVVALTKVMVKLPTLRPLAAARTVSVLPVSLALKLTPPTGITRSMVPASLFWKLAPLPRLHEGERQSTAQVMAPAACATPLGLVKVTVVPVCAVITKVPLLAELAALLMVMASPTSAAMKPLTPARVMALAALVSGPPLLAPRQVVCWLQPISKPTGKP